MRSTIDNITHCGGGLIFQSNVGGPVTEFFPSPDIIFEHSII